MLFNGRVRSIKAEYSIEFMRNKYPKLNIQACKAPPTIRTMEKWISDGVAKATDGCKVEPDGICPHGCESWLLALGWI